MLDIAIVVCTCACGVRGNVLVRRPELSIITIIHICRDCVHCGLCNDSGLMEGDAIAVWLCGQYRDDAVLVESA